MIKQMQSEGFLQPAPPPPTFMFLVEKLEDGLRSDERKILMLEGLLRGKGVEDGSGCEGIMQLCERMAADEVAFLRGRVKKYREELAQEVGARVVATAPKAEASS